MPSIDFNVKSFIGFKQLYENFKQQPSKKSEKMKNK